MIIGALFMVFGIISIFLFSRMEDEKIRRCSEETKAVIVKVKQKGSIEDKSVSYITDFEYTVEDTVYSVRYVLNIDMGVDTKVKIRYNPDDPGELYIPGIDRTADNNRLIGILATGVGLVIVVIAGGVISTRTYGF